MTLYCRLTLEPDDKLPARVSRTPYTGKSTPVMTLGPWQVHERSIFGLQAISIYRPSDAHYDPVSQGPSTLSSRLGPPPALYLLSTSMDRALVMSEVTLGPLKAPSKLHPTPPNPLKESVAPPKAPLVDVLPAAAFPNLPSKTASLDKAAAVEGAPGRSQGAWRRKEVPATTAPPIVPLPVLDASSALSNPPEGIRGSSLPLLHLTSPPKASDPTISVLSAGRNANDAPTGPLAPSGLTPCFRLQGLGGWPSALCLAPISQATSSKKKKAGGAPPQGSSNGVLSAHHCQTHFVVAVGCGDKTIRISTLPAYQPIDAAAGVNQEQPPWRMSSADIAPSLEAEPHAESTELKPQPEALSTTAPSGSSAASSAVLPSPTIPAESTPLHLWKGISDQVLCVAYHPHSSSESPQCALL